MSLSTSDKTLRLWDTRDRINAVEKAVHTEEAGLDMFDYHRGIVAGFIVRKPASDELVLYSVSEKGFNLLSSLKTKSAIRRIAWLRDCEE